MADKNLFIRRDKSFDKQAARDDTSRWHNYCFPFDAARLTLEEPSPEPKEKKNRSKRSNRQSNYI